MSLNRYSDNKKQVTEGKVNVENELITETYAEFDSDTGILRIFRDKSGKYENGTGKNK